MTDQNPPLPAPSEDHLRLLSVFHYVFAGFAVLGMGFLALHYGLMSQWMDPGIWEGRANPPPAGFMEFFAWILQFPVGTVLGVFTLVVITRTDVRASFRD